MLPISKHFHKITAYIARYNSVSAKQIQIPVPWGYVACQQFGEDSLATVICAHGYAENSGTFMSLLPHLPPMFKYAVIDLPGHGHSSHIPPGLFYTDPLYIYAIDATRRFFNEKKVGLLGHSMGAALNLAYVMSYHNCTRFIISVELSDFPSTTILSRLMHTARRIDKIMGQEKQRKQLRSKEDILKSTLAGYNGGIDLCTAQHIFDRYADEVEDGKFLIKTDKKAINNQVLSFVPNVISLMTSGPYQDVAACFIDGTEGFRYVTERQREQSMRTLGDMWGRVEYHRCSGGHSIYATHPLHISHIIRKFLQPFSAAPQ